MTSTGFAFLCRSIALTGVWWVLSCADRGSFAGGPPAKPPPLASPAPVVHPRGAPDARATALVEAMRLDEKLAYVGGERDFYIRAVPRLGIPEIKLADGPAGCRNWGPSTAYPSTVGLAATFDLDLASQVGRAMGRDCRARGVHILLAPGVNIQRSPLTGRNFEYLGEDPHVAGKFAVAIVEGVQAEGVLATVKHFAANNQEWDRNHVSSQVDERTLREIYLPAFEMAVREGQVRAVMSAYNLLNGIYASHHPWLLKTVLKEQWGFRGFVMSDWKAIHDPIGGAIGGCDLEMPSGMQMSPENLRTLLDSGAISVEDVDEKVFRILRTLIAAGFFDREQRRADVPLDDPSSRAVALRAARESLVLLKNDRGLLPLERSTVRKVAVIGPTAHPAVHGGSGSAYVTPTRAVSVRDGISATVPEVEVVYHPGIQERTTYAALGAAVFSGPVKEELFAGTALEGTPVLVNEVDRIDFDPDDGVAPAEGLGHEFYSIRWTAEVSLPAAGKYDVMTNADDGIRVFLDGAKVLDDWSDHAPRTRRQTVSLDKGRHRIVVEYYQGTLGAIAQFGIGPAIEGHDRFGAEEVAKLAAESDVVVLCLGYGQTSDSNSAARRFAAFWPPDWAREANLVESEDSDRAFELPEVQLETVRVATSKNPRTVVVLNAGGGVELDSWLGSVPGLLWAWYPGQEGGTAVAEVLFGLRSPAGKLPITLAKRYADHPSAPYYHVNEGGRTPYTEGLLVGYRGFDAAGTEPAFPFGFGLSYTTFVYSEPNLAKTGDGSVEVSFTLTNSGVVAGDEVAQVYVSPPDGQGRPPQKLEGFVRVSLPPGARRRVKVVLPPRAFAYWDDGWRVSPGSYGIHVAASSRDRRLTLNLEQPEQRFDP